MLNRREILKTGSSFALGATIMAGISKTAFAGDNAASLQLKQAFENGFQNILKLSPYLCTAVGLDNGALADQKSKLDHQTKESNDKYLAYAKNVVAEFKKIDRNALNASEKVNYDCVIWDAEQQIKGIENFKGFGNPYNISQLTGSYQSTPDFLDSMHSIENKADAEAYLSRLNEYAVVLNEETANFKSDSAIGLVPPDFILKRAIGQLKGMIATKEADQNLINSLVRRTKEKSIAGDWETSAKKIVNGPIREALIKQTAALEAKLKTAKHDAGIWRLPQGGERYAHAIKGWTTTNMNAEEIHKLGLEKVKEISSKIDVILRSQGMTKGTTGQRMAALNNDPKQHYANNDKAKEELIADLNLKVAEVYKKVPEYFNVLPKAKCDIKRVPKEIEAGAPGGYYNAGTLDGTRPGAYYINLRDTKEQPRWLLPTLTFHEAVPGHHFQISIQQEADLPMLRKIQGFGAYVEGWALYTEELANEMGMYENDPFGQAGFLHDALFRAVRLVVDTGMHAKRWSREKAIKYMADVTGDQVSAATTEIERYVVWPGQALSYMVGKIQWLKIRSMMMAKMGDKFSFKDFHDAGLLAGAVPLDILEQVYRDKNYI